MITIPGFPPNGKDPRTLVINIGNTNTRFGWFVGPSLRHTEAFSTSEVRIQPPDLPEAEAVAIVSVVPEAAERLMAAWSARAPRVLTAATAGLALDYAPAASLGADRLANALALIDRGLVPGIAVDCGTATTLTVVDARGVVVGGAIAPGLGTAAQALVGHTAQLRAVPMERPGVPWGHDTVTCLQIGMVEGHVGLIHHLVEGVRAGLGATAPVVLCGGWAETVAPGLPDYDCAPFLTLEGAQRFLRG